MKEEPKHCELRARTAGVRWVGYQLCHVGIRVERYNKNTDAWYYVDTFETFEDMMYAESLATPDARFAE